MYAKEIIVGIILLLAFFIIPVFVIQLENKYDIAKKVGAVLLSYAIGVILGNFGIFPDTTDAYKEILTSPELGGAASVPLDDMKEYYSQGTVSDKDLTRNFISMIQNWTTNISVLLALPLILFAMDVRSWFTQFRKAMISLVIGLVAVIIFVFIGFFLFREGLEDAGKIGGLLIGVYTGGTPNMAAIKQALGVSHETYIMTHTYEMFMGAFFLIFVFSIAQKTFRLFLPAYKSTADSPNIDVKEMKPEDDLESYEGMFKEGNLLPLLGAFGLSVLILGISFAIGSLFGDASTTVTVLMVTSLGIGASFVPRIRSIKKTFQLGIYVILIFCLSVASMADVNKLVDISVNLFYYVGFVMFGSHIFHAFMGRFFKLDADTVIISGTALICSPPFVPAVAASIGNKEVIMTGITIGIAGYAIGNFLGISVAEILMTWFV